MVDQEHDWLDERLAESSYIPDGGFTARVIDHLPESNLDNKNLLRRRILAVSTGSALALGVGLAIMDLPLLIHGTAHVPIIFSFTENAERFAHLVRQPIILYGGVAAVMVSALAVLPFLRRWV